MKKTRCVYLKDINGDTVYINMNNDVRTINEKLENLSRENTNKKLFLTYSGYGEKSLVYYEIELTEDDLVKQEIDDLTLRINQCMKSLNERSADYIRRVDCGDIEIPNDIDNMNLVELTDEMIKCKNKLENHLSKHTRKTND